jgi:uncharacterized membrane protein YGL010W
MARKTADDWFVEYSESHRNATNKTLHWICVPVIAACVIAFAWSIPRPASFASWHYLNWGTLLVAAAMVFYVRLSVPLSMGMLLFSLGVILVIVAWERWSTIPIWQPSLILFALAWFGQFIGHSIEGRKPSFFKDLQFLLIGPLWLLGFIYRQLAIRY